MCGGPELLASGSRAKSSPSRILGCNSLPGFTYTSHGTEAKLFKSISGIDRVKSRARRPLQHRLLKELVAPDVERFIVMRLVGRAIRRCALPATALVGAQIRRSGARPAKIKRPALP